MEKVNPSTNSIKIYELIYYIYFLILFGARAVGLYDGQTLYNICLVLGVIAFGFKLLTTRHSVAEYLTAFSLLSVGALSYICSGEKGLLLYFTMMLGMKGINEKKVFRLGLYVLGAAYFILYILSITGIITELNHINRRSGYGYLLRHSLGYPYPNTAHTTLLILMILFFYLYEASDLKKLLRASVIAMLINLYVYLYTVSLTGLISITIYLLVNLYLQIRKNRTKAENVIISILFPVVVIFSIAGPLLATGSLFTFLNKLLHKRYEYALYFLTNEKVTLFGSYFQKPPTNWYMLDNSFLYLFLQLGIIPFAVITLICLMWIKNLVAQNKTGELSIMITFCFIGMSDPFLFNLSYKNLTFIFLGKWLFDSLEKHAHAYPEILKKEFLLLPFGEKDITIKSIVPEKLRDFYRSSLYEIASHTLRYTLIFATVCMLGSVAYEKITTEPQVLYVNTKIADPYFDHKNIQMTTADIETALVAGDLVEGYSPEDPTMYVFKKKAPHMEYIRSIVSCGLWAGMISILLISIIRAVRKR
ncbi:hypothetical protein [Butyrivibrio sp. JL13D10]|uniref:hypothetical protein n=1 Tax=Butyrivibrio sp. JL13D10 TaxID=3236815 RepID=UPI0038B650DE